jgi:Family of unknown function (DUF5522)
MYRLEEHIDYYLDKNGLLVFTEKYLRDRGYCCNNGCRHCPYKSSEIKTTNQSIKADSLDRPDAGNDNRR